MADCPICGSSRDPKDRFCRTCGAVFTPDSTYSVVEAPKSPGAVTVADKPVEPAAEKPRRSKRVKRASESTDEPIEQRKGGPWIVLVVIIPLILCCCAIVSAQALMRLVSI